MARCRECGERERNCTCDPPEVPAGLLVAGVVGLGLLAVNSAFNYWRGDAPPGHKQLYHGTSTHNAGGILQHGLRASRNGTLGRGVYFTDNKETAMAIARYRARQTGGGRAVVVLCDVPEAHTRNTAMHAPWAGVSRDFREYCVNEKEVTVRAVEPVPP